MPCDQRVEAEDEEEEEKKEDVRAGCAPKEMDGIWGEDQELEGRGGPWEPDSEGTMSTASPLSVHSQSTIQSTMGIQLGRSHREGNGVGGHRETGQQPGEAMMDAATGATTARRHHDGARHIDSDPADPIDPIKAPRRES